MWSFWVQFPSVFSNILYFNDFNFLSLSTSLSTSYLHSLFRSLWNVKPQNIVYCSTLNLLQVNDQFIPVSILKAGLQTHNHAVWKKHFWGIAYISVLYFTLNVNVMIKNLAIYMLKFGMMKHHFFSCLQNILSIFKYQMNSFCHISFTFLHSHFPTCWTIGRTKENMLTQQVFYINL